MKILFPQSVLNPKSSDESFELEYNAAVTTGFIPYLYDHDEVVKSGILNTNLSQQEGIEPIFLRAWMFKKNQYEFFHDTLLQMGYILINDELQYIRCHHSAETHSVFGDNTPKIIYLPNVSLELFQKIFTVDVLEEKIQEMKQYFNSEYFILKDSVKSEKNIPEIFKIPINISAEELHDRIVLFINERGKLYNNGLVFKEFVNLKINAEQKANEWRAFFLRGKLLTCTQNTGIVGAKKPDVNWISNFAKQIQSNFFTIDVAQKDDDSWTVIETGDGQVSGLSPGQNELKFYDGIKKIMPKKLVNA